MVCAMEGIAGAGIGGWVDGALDKAVCWNGKIGMGCSVLDVEGPGSCESSNLGLLPVCLGVVMSASASF